MDCDTIDYIAAVLVNNPNTAAGKQYWYNMGCVYSTGIVNAIESRMNYFRKQQEVEKC